MNEDTWQNLDTREQRDRELTRVNLNDAPVRFGERELKAGMNNSEMMGSGESNWKYSWIAPDGWNELLGNVVISKKILRTRKIMVMHSNERGECCPRTLVDQKRKR